jgi:hypothetical protein
MLTITMVSNQPMTSFLFLMFFLQKIHNLLLLNILATENTYGTEK